MKILLEHLENNKKIPMHMPGHKRNTSIAPYLKRLGADLDITEIDGFDNLHNATGILRESMKRAADLRGADCAFYLVNGATGGILAAVCAILGRGDKVIVARNCHKSVYNAIELVGAKPVFVMPKICKKTGIQAHIDKDLIKEKIAENPDAKLVILTSPTYEGVVSDISGISDICKKAGVFLMVDGAHGAHLGFGFGFPKDAYSCGADVVVESLHKTLPSLTQTAICYTKKEIADKIEEKLAVFETSSPSYLLMASIDGCISILTEKAEELFSVWQDNLQWFYEKCKDLKNISVLTNCESFFDRDSGKIVLLCENGKWLFDELRKRHIECEMASCTYVLAMTGVGDTREMLSYFVSCLFEIDKIAGKSHKNIVLQTDLPELIMLPHDVKNSDKECIPFEDAGGRIAAEYVWAYPPGIPIVIPGERIGDAEINIFCEYEATGIELSGSAKSEKGKILVVK